MCIPSKYGVIVCDPFAYAQDLGRFSSTCRCGGTMCPGMPRGAECFVETTSANVSLQQILISGKQLFWDVPMFRCFQSYGFPPCFSPIRCVGWGAITENPPRIPSAIGAHAAPMWRVSLWHPRPSRTLRWNDLENEEHSFGRGRDSNVVLGSG